MARGDKPSYTDKQKRQAEHIEDGFEDRGISKEEAERRAWATVNKETGGGLKKKSSKKPTKKSVKSSARSTKNSPSKKSGSGRKKAARKKSS